MTLRELTNTDRIAYENLTQHPLQSWKWGEFRRDTGVEVVRIGEFKNNNLIAGYQVTFHSIPHLPFQIGYLPKGPLPTLSMVKALTHIGLKRNAIFIQLEPNVNKETTDIKLLLSNKLRTSARPLFTKYTFHIDLTKSEDELKKQMSSKTRYNIRLSQKHEVTVQEENTQQAFNRYLELTTETTKRQRFYSHSEAYHRTMWHILHPAKIAHLLTARYKGKILTTWIVFLYKDVLYYPYGASTTEHKDVMASNLMMWEAMRWGKRQGAKIFDLWGTPGPDPKPTDSYYGFHKFKLGYGPKLVEFAGSYDLILKPFHYQLYMVADKLRWFFLKHKSH